MLSKISAFLVLFCITITASQSQPKTFNTYRDLGVMQQAAPGAFKFGLYGFSNPAMLEYVNSPFDAQISVNAQGNTQFLDGSSKVNNWGVFTALGRTGVGAFTRRTAAGNWVTDYRISTTAGTKELSLGFGYGFSGENKSEAGFSNMYNLGLLYRPIEQLSVGVVFTDALESSFNEAVVDVSIRPMGEWPITLFGDYSIAQVNDGWGDIAALGGRNSLETWSAGASVEFPFLEGIRFNGRYTNPQGENNEMIMMGVDFSLGGSGIGGTIFTGDNASGESTTLSNTTHFRFGAYDRTIMDNFSFVESFVKIDLSGPITYQPFLYFDNRKSFYSILEMIDKAAKDENVSGLFVNSVNMGGSYAMQWEIRNKLKEFKEEYGKEVVIFVERENITKYHFASIADKIVMDEYGGMVLSGFVAGRSYYQNLLDKIGVGSTELRFMKYKSAVESYNRTDFSEGDKEQREAYINDWYNIAKEEIIAERGISAQEFDDIVNGKISYNADELIELKLVDKVGRWNELDDIEEELTTRNDFTVSSGALYKPSEPIDDQWSLDKDLLAVIYADGVCAMSGGIDARNLWRYVEQAMENPNIGAIVLRVDSPGGDPLASEYIAKILRDNKGKKPIIVSQGMLAASGGYWLSMDADEIYSTPMTITGSIGVISNWFYDKGLQDTLGITTDHVSVGKYADLGFAWRDPILGAGLPIRDFTEEEAQLRKDEILELYEDFVSKVADGRGMEVEEVKEVAQGRVWTGRRALGNKLVDKLGGLSDAMDRAKDLMDVEDKDDIIVVQYPPRGDVDFSSFLPNLLPISTSKVNAATERINFIFNNNGIPMPMLPLDWQGDSNFKNNTDAKQVVGIGSVFGSK